LISKYASANAAGSRTASAQVGYLEMQDPEEVVDFQVEGEAVMRPQML
jgi:hypothetical protein